MTAKKHDQDRRKVGGSSDVVRALHSLDSLRELKSFLNDLCTPQEVLEFSRRWRAARYLSIGWSYSKITKETGLSSATIARIAKRLRAGSAAYRRMARAAGKK